MFTKIKNIIKSASLFDEIQEDDINTSVIDWYSNVLQDDTPIKYTYFVQYHGYTHVVSWGPFKTIELAKQWIHNVEQTHNISCNIVPALDPNSNPKKWPF